VFKEITSGRVTFSPWSRVFFFGEFSPPGDKNKRGAGESNKGISENFLKKYLEEEKELEVARFRQCVPLGRQI
jgi:hypothetical protein